VSLEYVIQTILDESGVRYKTNARSFIANCPRCGKADKIYIDKEDGHFICWVCADVDGFKGPNPVHVLQTLTGYPRDQIKAMLYGVEAANRRLVGIDVNLEEVFPSFKEQPLVPFELSPEMVQIDTPEAQDGRNYLLQRGIPGQVALEYGLRYWPRFRRVIFPLTIEGICYGYQARMIDPLKDGDIKILSSRDFPRKRVVMFADRLRDKDYAVVSEGPVDAIKAHLCGGNIATMGKHITPQQIEFIKSYGVRKIYFALDPDALDALPKLAHDCGVEAYILRVPPGREDLGDSTPLEVLNQMKVAEPIRSGFLNLDRPDDPFLKR
jgi:DNA primase